MEAMLILASTVQGAARLLLLIRGLHGR